MMLRLKVLKVSVVFFIVVMVWVWLCIWFSVFRCVLLKFCILIDRWVILVLWNVWKWFFLKVFGLVLSVILVLVFSCSKVCVLFSRWLMVLGENRLGVLLLMNMLCIV